MVVSSQQIIEKLGLAPHPEGGWYKETWRAEADAGTRASGTAIYFLLEQGQRSHWHKVDATEIWLYHAGAPLTLELSDDGTATHAITLGPHLENSEQPQAIVPPHCWQAAKSLGEWTLVSCTVSPGFEFEGFELAPPDWTPGG
ncbi:MAG: cupin domain-containing protein [Pseudomonadota bacterium]